METKPLLYGLIGFFVGGVIVSIAATTFEKPKSNSSDMSMEQMTEQLADKQGDDFDSAFLQYMTEHHDGAIEMARLAETRATHEEIKQLSKGVIAAQEKEIDQMQLWQKEWGFRNTESHDSASH